MKADKLGTQDGGGSQEQPTREIMKETSLAEAAVAKSSPEGKS